MIPILRSTLMQTEVCDEIDNDCDELIDDDDDTV